MAGTTTQWFPVVVVRCGLPCGAGPPGREFEPLPPGGYPTPMSDPSTGEALELALLEAIAALEPPAGRGPGEIHGGGLTTLRAMFQAQCLSRHVDLVARRLRAQGHGYYTIGSAGHESNAAVALASRSSDPALLHYRSGAFYIARALAARSETDPVDDIISGMLAHTDEPISGGRHKVFGHPDLAIIPQTSTIASHLPRAVGVAFAIGRASKFDQPLWWPADAVTICSFGDASVNHSTALGAINSACHLAFQNLPLPLLFVCEDNGVGISVRTPPAWVNAAFRDRPGLRYVQARGDEPEELLATTNEAVDWVRRRRRPAFLHLQTVRYLGHAGSDAELGYRTAEEIRAGFSRDPILGLARVLVGRGLEPASLVEEYLRHGRYVEARAQARLRLGREISTAEEVMAPLAPRSATPLCPPSSERIPGTSAGAVGADAGTDGDADADPGTGPGDADAGPAGSGSGGGRTFAQAVNATLAALLEADPGVLVFGEDVAVKGGVYGVTKGLRSQFGAARVFDSLLDEQSILGVALGTAVSGLLPVAEIQYLAYLHNAEDQLRGEAATLQFFSQGAYDNGMVVRIAGYGYQKGFGGHFHNDDSVTVLRDIPGLVVASPARPADAAAMLRSLALAARADGTVGVFLEPIALYHTADLHAPGDRAWLEPVVSPRLDGAADGGAYGDGWGELAPIGSIRRYGPDDADVTIVTWGNGLFMSLRVAARLAARAPEAGPGPVRCQVIDLRWLAPLPVEAVLATSPRRVLVVDETRRSGGVSEGVLAGLVDGGYDGPMARVASKDSFIPLGDAARLVLLSEDEIAGAVIALAQRPVLPAAMMVRSAPQSTV
jgi:2-oxoisovalerate dehydrogenase E1 component